jgi:hypothetical protein
MNFIKENGGPLVVGAAVLTIAWGYVELRLPDAVDKEVTMQLEASGIVTSATVTSMQRDINENAEDIEDTESDVDNLTDRWNRLVDAIAAADQN